MPAVFYAQLANTTFLTPSSVCLGDGVDLEPSGLDAPDGATEDDSLDAQVVARLHRMGASDAPHSRGDPRHAGGHRRDGPRVVATETLLLCCPVLYCRRAKARRTSA